MTSIASYLYLSIILTSVGGFLLDGNTATGQKQYLTLSEFYENKNEQQHETDEIRHKMEQMKNDNAKTLALLSSQLQQKFIEIQNNITAASQYNETARLTELWELKYHELQKNNTELQIKFNDLEVKYTALKNEINFRPTTLEMNIQNAKCHNASKELFLVAEKELVYMKNKTTVLENKMDTISQLKAVQQLQDLHSVQNQIQEISTQTHSLSVNEQARNQDFLALYNLTTVYGMKLHDLEIQTVDKLKKHANDQNKTIIGFEDKILKHIHTTDMKIESLANTSRERSSNISETVTLTACAQADHNYNNEIMMIKNVKVHVGINSLASIQSSGIFTCENPGLYLVDASIINNAGISKFSIRKNRSVVIQSYGCLHEAKYESASLVAAVELNIGDTIDIHADNNVYLKSLGSCVTIVKIR